MILNTIKNALEDEFPKIKFNIHELEDNTEYDIIEIHMDDDDHQIVFRQCISGGSYDELEEDEVALNSVEIVNRSIAGYDKLDRANILKEKRMIRILNQMEAISFHKLTEDELAERMERYKIAETEFKKKEE